MIVNQVIFANYRIMDPSVALDLLESRVEQLEMIFAAKEPLEHVDISKVKPVVEALHEVDTVLLSTLSGREQTASLVNRVTFLENLVDPAFLETSLNIDLKMQAILESETDLISFCQGIQRLQDLESLLNSNSTSELIAHKDSLLYITDKFLSLKEECDQHSSAVKQLFIDYKRITLEVSDMLLELDNLINCIEGDNSSG